MGFRTETLELWRPVGMAKQMTHDRCLDACLHLDLGFDWTWLPYSPLLCPNYPRRYKPRTWGRIARP